MLIRCYGVKLLSVSVFLPQLAGRWLDDSDDKVQAEFKKCVYNGESELERGGPFQFQNLEGGSQAPTEWIRSCRRGNQAIGRIWHLELALKACGNASTRFITVYQFSTPITFNRLQVVASHLTHRSTPAEAEKEFVQLVSLFTTTLACTTYHLTQLTVSL